MIAALALLLVSVTPGLSSGQYFSRRGNSKIFQIGPAVTVPVVVGAGGWARLNPSDEDQRTYCADVLSNVGGTLAEVPKGPNAALRFELDGRTIPPGKYHVEGAPKPDDEFKTQMEIDLAFPAPHPYFVCERRSDDGPIPEDVRKRELRRVSKAMATICEQPSCATKGLGVVLNNVGLVVTTEQVARQAADKSTGMVHVRFSDGQTAQYRIPPGATYVPRSAAGTSQGLAVLVPMRDVRNRAFATPLDYRGVPDTRLYAVRDLDDVPIRQDALDAWELGRLVGYECERCSGSSWAGAAIVDGKGNIVGVTDGNAGGPQPTRMQFMSLATIEDWIGSLRKGREK